MKRLLKRETMKNVLKRADWFIGSTPSKLSSLPQESAMATVQFSVEENDMPDLAEAVSIFGDVSATLIEVPVDSVKAAFMNVPEISNDHADFDAYHTWYVSHGDTPKYGAENRWPCLATDWEDDVFIDGAHRFHSYIRDGHKTIPVLVYDTNEWWACHAQWLAQREVKTPCPDVENGIYVGKVLDITDGVVTQKVNRDGSTVRHLMSKLSEPVEMDAVIEISYTGGAGEVTRTRSQMVKR